MNKQSQNSKIGEIQFRKEILKQHLGLSNLFKNEPSRQQFIKLQREKLIITKKTFKILQKNYKISPFLEIGAEYCLRSALLKNNFKAKGFATDISLYSLIAAKKMVPKLNYKRIPQRICADANNLPFKSNSFSFVFVYETLHHFPDPKPILQEIQRVLAPGGICLIGADPIKQTMQVRLWRRPNKLRFWEKLLKLTLILPFISHIGKTEVGYGIIEDAFSLKTWQNSLSVFDKVEARIAAYPFGPKEVIHKNAKKNWLSPKPFLKMLIFFLGGSMEAICIKKGRPTTVPDHNLADLLICPNCLYNQKLEIKIKNFLCTNCKSSYAKNHEVSILLEQRLSKKLFHKKQNVDIGY